MFKSNLLQQIVDSIPVESPAAKLKAFLLFTLLEEVMRTSSAEYIEENDDTMFNYIEDLRIVLED